MQGIILDTNIISVLFFGKENRNVKDWVSSQDPEFIHITSINFAEILFGIRQLVPGKRRESLQRWFDEFVYPNFSSRILPFDFAAADRWASLHASDCIVGKQRPLADGYIAAIALVHGFAIATHNRRDFDRLDLRIIDPFLPQTD